MENEDHKETKMKGGKTNTELYIQIAIIGVLLFLVGFSAGKISSGNSGRITGAVTSTGIGRVSAAEIVPQGIPSVYGKELGIS